MENRSYRPYRPSRRRPDPVGLMMIGGLVGVITASAAALLGASWWVALLAYSFGGSAGVLASALFASRAGADHVRENTTGDTLATARDALS